MLSRLILLFAATAILLAECVVVDSPPQYGDLEILATDHIGAIVAQLETELVPLFVPVGKEPGPIRGRSSFEKLPYGRYRLQASAPGFRTATTEVFIVDPKTTVRVDFVIATTGCGSSSRVNGRITGSDYLLGLWVKAIPVRGNLGAGEAPVDRLGLFTLSDLEERAYHLFVLRGEELLHHEIVNLAERRGETNLSINLGGAQ